jgi:replicative DNA helicase
MSIKALAAEQEALSATLISTAVAFGMLDEFQTVPLDAFSVRCRPFAEAMVALHKAGVSVEASTLLSALKATGVKRDWGAELVDLSVESSTPAAFGHHADRLMVIRAAFAAGRHLLVATSAASEARLDDALDALKRAQEAAEETATIGEDDTATVEEAAIELQRRLDAGEGASVPVLTGYDCFDRALRGSIFAETRMVVIGARPGVGKTALGLNLAVGAARHSPVLYWCGEMPRDQLLARMAVSLCEVPLPAVLDGRMSPQQRDQLRETLGELSSLPIVLSDKSSMNPARIDVVIRRMIRAGTKPRMVVIDYLQRMKVQTARSREQEVNQLAQDIKGMAVEHNICIVVMVQLNRNIESRASREPQLSDLRESGGIEQEADSVIFPDRPNTYDKGVDPRVAKLAIRKNRHGPNMVTFDMAWDGSQQRWSER